MGLVNEVVELADLMEATLANVRRIAGKRANFNPPGKQAIRRGTDMSISDGLAFEIEAYNRMVPTSDRREGGQRV